MMKVKRIKAGKYIVEVDGKPKFSIEKLELGWIVEEIRGNKRKFVAYASICLLYTSPSPRDRG